MFDYKKAKPGQRFKGSVTNFYKLKGFGFIQCETGDKVFAHFSDIQGQKYRTLTEGEEVEFSIVQGKKGLQAVDIRRLNPPAEEDGEEQIVNIRKW